jgi:hypothetical protein
VLFLFVSPSSQIRRFYFSFFSTGHSLLLFPVCRRRAAPKGIFLYCEAFSFLCCDYLAVFFLIIYLISFSFSRCLPLLVLVKFLFVLFLRSTFITCYLVVSYLWQSFVSSSFQGLFTCLILLSFIEHIWHYIFWFAFFLNVVTFI